MLDLYSRVRRVFVWGLFSLLASSAAQASYSNLFIFGDSLSDTGNVYLASGGVEPPDPPYHQGRLTNGPTWVETFAAGLGLPSAATAWLAGGNNHAWAGAFTGMDGIAGANTGLQAQILGQWGGIADPDALYVMMIGGNDFRYVDAQHQVTSTPYSDVQTVHDQVRFALEALIASGVRHVLVANVPDLGVVPESAGHRAESTALVSSYNQALSATLADLAATRPIEILSLDLFGLLDELVADTRTGGARHGFLDADVPCLLPGAVSCDQSIFFDGLHPTARVHDIMGQAALALIAANTVPEPASLALLLVGLWAWAALRGRRRAWVVAVPAGSAGRVGWVQG